MDKAKIERYGDDLYQALVRRKPVNPLTDREPEITSMTPTRSSCA